MLIAASAQLSIAQNLIQNGDLEDTIPRPFGYKFAKFWDIPTDGSPDYMSGFHNGFDNRAYAKIDLIFRVQKSDPRSRGSA